MCRYYRIVSINIPVAHFSTVWQTTRRKEVRHLALFPSKNTMTVPAQWHFYTIRLMHDFILNILSILYCQSTSIVCVWMSVCMSAFVRSDISETKGDGEVVSYREPIGKCPRESNGHVTDTVWRHSSDIMQHTYYVADRLVVFVTYLLTYLLKSAPSLTEWRFRIDSSASKNTSRSRSG